MKFLNRLTRKNYLVSFMIAFGIIFFISANAQVKKIPPETISYLKKKEGVFLENKNYNVVIQGKGTGLRSPSEAQWQKIQSEGRMLISYATKDGAPASFDNSEFPWFPPIGNQGAEGSCVAWATGYYLKTFQEAHEHNWDLSGETWVSNKPTESGQDKIFSPDFIYHQINGGVDNGAYYFDAMYLMEHIGCASWANMPYSDIDHTSWPGIDAWREAPLFRSATGYTFMYTRLDSELENLKQMLSDTNLVVISIDANRYSNLSANDLWTDDSYNTNTTNHANTIVGYDDNYGPYIENGVTRYGAFKVANSWGTGGWENVTDGFYYISYECMKNDVEYVTYFENLLNYEPQMLAVYNISHVRRGDCGISFGIGPVDAPYMTKHFNEEQNLGGGNHPFPANDMALDITEFQPFFTGVSDILYEKVYDSGPYGGEMNLFSVEIYEDYHSAIPVETHNAKGLPVATEYLTDVVAVIQTDTGNAEISISPLSFSMSLLSNTDTTQGLAIINIGNGILNIDLAVSGFNNSETGWINVTPQMFSVDPGNSYTADIHLDATGLLPETYTANINIVSNDPDESSVVIPVTLTVEANEPVCQPQWSVVNYTNSTTAYGIVTIDEQGTAASTGDLVGVFVGDECRAIGECILDNGTAYVTLVIQGELVEKAEFRIWDASECTTIYEALCAETNPGGSIGYPPDFLMIGSGDGCVVEQSLALESGWNLMSLYVHPEDMTPPGIFAPFTCVTQVKDMTQSWDPALADFLNTLDSLTDGMAYFVNSSCQQTDTVIGETVDGAATVIPLKSGWNLIGYPFEVQNTTTAAFSSLIDAGILVQMKNMTQSYDPTLPDFLNTLKYIDPGKGYLINVSSDVDFIYPEPPAAAHLKSATTAEVSEHWDVQRYTQSMAQYGRVTLDGMPVERDAVVGAFVNGECRGQAMVRSAEGESYTTLVIHGETDEPVSFRLFMNGETYTSGTGIVTEPGLVTRDILALNFSGDNVTGIRSMTKDIGLRVYPNPAEDYLTIDYELGGPSDVEVMILDMLGKSICIYKENSSTGSNRITIEDLKTNYKMNAGTYILRFSDDRHIAIRKIIINCNISAARLHVFN